MTYPKLPKRFKKQWLKALRSGEYEQGRHELKRTDNTYCCLGVAGEIVGCSNKHLLRKSVFPMKTTSAIIQKVPEILRGSVDVNPVVGKLTKMNDEYGFKGHTNSFNKIAAWIEKYL